MERYFGHIDGTMGFGQPISLVVSINGYARFSTLAEQLHTERIDPYLRKNRWNLHSTKVSGFTPFEDEPIKYEIVAKDVGLEDKFDPDMPVKKVEIDGEETYVPDHDIKAHEENHKEVMALGLWDRSKYSGPAKAYFTIITESLAEVLGDLETLAHDTDKKVMMNLIQRRGKFGWELLGIASDAQYGKTHDNLRERIENAYTTNNFFRDGLNWAHIVNDVEYNGLYGACFDLIRTYGEPEGKEIIYDTIRKLQDAPDALDALLYLQKKLPHPRSIPLIKELNIALNDSYFEHTVSSGDSLFELNIWCQNNHIPIAYAKVLVDYTKRVTDHVLANFES